MKTTKTFLIFAVLVLGLMLVACGNADDQSDTARQLDPDSPAGRGQQLFRTHCATCHAVQGDHQIVGPSLDGIARQAAQRVEGLDAEAYIRESILYPNEHVVEGYTAGAMPQNFGRDLTSQQLDDLVAYLLTLD